MEAIKLEGSPKTQEELGVVFRVFEKGELEAPDPIPYDDRESMFICPVCKQQEDTWGCCVNPECENYCS